MSFLSYLFKLSSFLFAGQLITMVGKGSDEGCKMMMAATREQREQMKMRGRKLGPVEAGPVIR